MSRALVFDLDGTLLDGRGDLSQRTAESLRSARHEGCLLAVATARPLRLVLPVLGEHRRLFDCLMVSNGAATIDACTLRPIDLAQLRGRSMSRAIVRARGTWPDCGLGWESGGGFFHDPRFAQIATERRIVRDLEHAPRPKVGRRADQVVIATRDLHSAADLEGFARAVGDRLSVTDSSGGVIEVAARAADKSTAMLRWARRRGVPPSDIVAFGDGLNDVRMLQAAGTGVAMGNAIPAAVAVAQHVALRHDEDGVADFLDRRP